jgi:hypothetical protein
LRAQAFGRPLHCSVPNLRLCKMLVNECKLDPLAEDEVRRCCLGVGLLLAAGACGRQIVLSALCRSFPSHQRWVCVTRLTCLAAHVVLPLSSLS